MSRFTRGRDGGGDPENGDGGGPPPGEKGPGWSHGGYACAKLYQERQLDLSRPDHLILHRLKQDMIEDLGGVQELSAFQSMMIDQVMSLTIILNRMSEYVEQRGIMQDDGQLTACLRASYLQYCNTARHSLRAAYEASRLRPRKPPDLKHYLEANYSEDKEAEDARTKEGNRRRRRESDPGEEDREDPVAGRP